MMKVIIKDMMMMLHAAAKMMMMMIVSIRHDDDAWKENWEAEQYVSPQLVFSQLSKMFQNLVVIQIRVRFFGFLRLGFDGITIFQK